MFMSFCFPCDVWSADSIEMFDKYNLKIGSWNIGGNAKVKCEHDDVTWIIKSHDIFAILESWLDHEESCPRIENYINFRSERKKKSKAKRNSGGMIIYCPKTLSKGIRKIKSSSQDILWLQLDRSFWAAEWFIHLCSIPSTRVICVYQKHWYLPRFFQWNRLLFHTGKCCGHWRPKRPSWHQSGDTDGIKFWSWYPGAWNC